MIVKTGADVHIAQTFVDGRTLSWIEEQSALGYGTRGFRLRKLTLEAP